MKEAMVEDCGTFLYLTNKQIAELERRGVIYPCIDSDDNTLYHIAAGHTWDEVNQVDSASNRTQRKIPHR